MKAADEADLNIERERLIYQSTSSTSLRTLICNPQAGLLAWVEEDEDGEKELMGMLQPSEESRESLPILKRCGGCGGWGLESVAVSIDYASETGRRSGAVLFIRTDGSLSRVQGQFPTHCQHWNHAMREHEQMAHPERVLRLTADWHYYYWLLNETTATGSYESRIHFAPREQKEGSERVKEMEMSSLLVEDDKAPSMDTHTYQQAGSSIDGTFLRSNIGRTLRFTRMDLRQVFDIKAMAPEMRDVWMGQVAENATLEIKMTSSSTAVATYRLFWPGGDTSARAVMVNFKLYERSEDLERRCLSKGQGMEEKCSLPPAIQTFTTEFRGTRAHVPLQGLHPSRRLLLLSTRLDKG